VTPNMVLHASAKGGKVHAVAPRKAGPSLPLFGRGGNEDAEDGGLGCFIASKGQVIGGNYELVSRFTRIILIV
jgi:hypothetical protein